MFATTLAQKKCGPCRRDVPPLKGEKLQEFVRELGGGWQLVDEHHLEKEYRFDGFAPALNFVEQLGEIAEREGHHPDIFLSWGKVRVTIYTHKIDGLSDNDFILAAKYDQYWSEIS